MEAPPPFNKTAFPRLSPIAILGGIPTTGTDIPITAVFMALFVCCAAFHMTVFQLNNRRKHKFILSGMLFGFCMSRIVTCIMRIVWAEYPTDIPVAIASQVFNNAGVVLLWVANFIFAARIFRSVHPTMQHNKLFNTFVKVYIASLVACLLQLICAVVLSFYTINKTKQDIFKKMRRTGQIYFAIFSIAPIILLAIAFAIPRRKERVPLGKRTDLKTQVFIVFTASLICSFAAFFRAIIGFYPRSNKNPGWYNSRAIFYVTYFTIEVITVAMFAILRVDQRFHIPNKADRKAALERGKAVEPNQRELAQAEFDKEAVQDQVDAENAD